MSDFGGFPSDSYQLDHGMYPGQGEGHDAYVNMSGPGGSCSGCFFAAAKIILFLAFLVEIVQLIYMLLS